MATYKFASTVNEVVPAQATYSFPTQQTKIHKHLVKLPPKNGASFSGSNSFSIEFPSDNYLNVLNSVLQFDLEVQNCAPQLLQAAADSETVTRAGGSTIQIKPQTQQPNAVAGKDFFTNQFAGCAVAYIDPDSGWWQTATVLGSDKNTLYLDNPMGTPLANGTFFYVTRDCFFQQGGAHNLFTRLRFTYGSEVLEDIMEYSTLARILYEAGVATSYMGSSGSIVDGTYGPKNTDPRGNLSSAWQSAETQAKIGLCRKRTFTLNLFSGLMTCRKLIPLKWMAAQFKIEFTLNREADVFIATTKKLTDAAEIAAPANFMPAQIPDIQMTLSNINFIAELIEFDSTYDAMFYMGLTGPTGVPLKFNSWHHHSFTVSGSEQVYQIHERARSVKMALCVIRDKSAGQSALSRDTDIFYHDMGAYTNADGAMVADPAKASLIREYQFRIGGRYYPSQPVRCINGGAEAFCELQKCINTLGDYRSDCNIGQNEWQAHGSTTDPYNQGILGGTGNKFIMAASFEFDDLDPNSISGVNAEEQSDIALKVVCSGPGPDAAYGKIARIFINYDCLIVVKGGNSIELIL